MLEVLTNPSQRKDIPRKVAACNDGLHFGKCRIVSTFLLQEVSIQFA